MHHIIDSTALMKPLWLTLSTNNINHLFAVNYFLIIGIGMCYKLCIRVKSYAFVL